MKSNKVGFIALIFSLFLIFSGVISISFTYFIYPSLIPGYGAGERFYLGHYNNYTTQFPWYANSRLHLTITANDTIQIFRDKINIHNGTHYEIIIEPQEYVLITLKSDSSVSGKFIAYQEIPWELQVGSFLLLLIGCILTCLSILHLIKYHKKKKV